MKKIHLLVILIASLLSMASESLHTVDLTVINKSEVDIGLMLNSMTDDDRWYYFTIPAGFPDEPQGTAPTYTERNFEIVRDYYTSVAYFMEPYDPVYGYPYCGNKTVASRLEATHSVKLVFNSCKKDYMDARIYHLMKRFQREPKSRAR